jgi:hypothetical protein
MLKVREFGQETGRAARLGARRAFMMSSSGGGRTLLAAVFLICAIAGGMSCAGRDAGADSAVAAGAPIRSRHTRAEDLTGDGRSERLVLTSEGPTYDSLDVRLEIRSPEDSLLYAASWNSRFYFQYDDRSAMTDSAVAMKVRAHLGRVLADSAFRVGGRGITSDTMRLSMMRDAIRYDIATERWRSEHGLQPGDPLPPAAHDSINTLARGVLATRIDSLVAELGERRSFQYFAGGEVTYAIAWSDRERRFVTIFSCC